MTTAVSFSSFIVLLIYEVYRAQSTWSIKMTPGYRSAPKKNKKKQNKTNSLIPKEIASITKWGGLSYTGREIYEATFTTVSVSDKKKKREKTC